MTFKPRDYQLAGFADILSAWNAGIRSLLYVLPTGGGKSPLFRMVIEDAVARSLNVLVLAHRDNLIRQASDHVATAGIRHGLISPKYPTLGYRVQVASVASVLKRRGQFPDPDVIIIDEAHHAAASTYRAILEAFPHARVLGLTATPRRLDGRPLGDLFEKMIEGPTMAWLIDEGYLSPYRFFAPPPPAGLADLRVRGSDYSEADLSALFDRPKLVGDVVENYLQIAGMAPALAFGSSIDHAEHLAGAFASAGIRSRALHSAIDPMLSDEYLRSIRDGYLDVLTSCEMIGEGTDITGIAVADLDIKTESVTKYLQDIGRALRPDYGYRSPTTRHERRQAIADGPKPTAFVIDHGANYERHGLPSDPRSWSLDGTPGEPTERSALKLCPSCYFMAPVGARRCPECGAEFERRSRPEAQRGDGSLVEIGTTLEDAIRRGGYSVVQARGIAATLGFSPEEGERVFEALRITSLSV